MAQIFIPSAQSSQNGDITKITDTNGNGRGYFADILDGRFNLLIDQVTFLNNDSSFFPRYGAIQLNLEPAVDGANARINNVTIMGTGLHDPFPRPNVDPPAAIPTPDGFIDAGSAIRIVTNPGLGVEHNFIIENSEISFNFSDGIKYLMLTEGLRTAAIPEGTTRLLVRNNRIEGNVGITDHNEEPLIFPLYNSLDDYDSPGNVAPFPVGLLSNPDLKDEFFDNLNGSGLIVRAKGTDNSRFFLDILDNQIINNEFDAINIAFAGRGNIDFVPSPTPPDPAVVPPVPLTPVRVYDPVIRDPITGVAIASVLSPDTFGVSATVVIDNNQIGLGNLDQAGPTPGSGFFEDAIKVTLLDGSKVQMRISNNFLNAGDARGTVTTTVIGPQGTITNTTGNIPLPPQIPLFEATLVIPINAPGAPAVDPGYDSAIEVDTWDTSRLVLIIDNNDITATRAGLATGPHWGDGGITIQSHENTVLATRITRNRVNEVLDGNTDFSDIFTVRTPPSLRVELSGAAINLLAEGNSVMVAFVNNNDMENRNQINDPVMPSTGMVASDAYFEATSADNATLCLQLLDNNAEQGISPQLSHTTVLFGDAFYLVQTENSVFEIEPTRATNHEVTLPEIISIQTAVLAYGGPGPLLPASDFVQYGNVPSGTCEIRVRELLALGFPFDVGFPSLVNFDPPIIHP
jgi:hypothetical protein